MLKYAFDIAESLSDTVDDHSNLVIHGLALLEIASVNLTVVFAEDGHFRLQWMLDQNEGECYGEIFR